MAKDIRITDPETSAKKEVMVEVPETVEIPVIPEASPETQETPETKEDAQTETSIESTDSQIDETPTTDLLATTPVAEPVATPQVDRLEEEIEDILEEDLKEMYLSMSPEKQAEFREKGEETRSRIRVLVGSAKVNAKKIFHLIRGWLKTMPGVNRFFLEQEAKIKTDKILFVTEEEKRKQNENV